MDFITMKKNLVRTTVLSIAVCSCFAMNSGIIEAMQQNNDVNLQDIITNIEYKKDRYMNKTFAWLAPELSNQISPTLTKIDEILEIVQKAQSNQATQGDYDMLQNNFNYLKSLDGDTRRLGKDLLATVLYYENNIINIVQNRIPHLS